MTITPHDDRVEVVAPAHPTAAGLDWEGTSFSFCGYNRVQPKLGAVVLARHGDDPNLALGTSGRGRRVAVTSDLGPHWAGDVVRRPGYARFWAQLLAWLGASGGIVTTIVGRGTR